MDVLKDSKMWASASDLDPDFGLEKGYFFPEPRLPSVRRDIRAVVLNSDESLNLASASEGGAYQFSRASANGFPLADFQPTSAEFAPGGTSIPTRLLLQPDGKIIMIGTFTNKADDILCSVSRPAITRFNANGTPDLVFGRHVLTHAPEGATEPQIPKKLADGCLQPDGKILIANAYQLSHPNSSNFVSKLTRLNSDGSLDLSFGNSNNGSIDLVFDGATTFATNVQVQRDGKIIVGGAVIIDGHYQLTLARYTYDGSPDLTFGENGYARYIQLDPKHNTVLNQLVVRQDKLLCAGFTTGPERSALLMRFDADGHVDPQFNDGKPVLTHDGFNNLQWACASVQTSGNIIVLGNAQTNNGKEFTVKRFLDNGRPDLSHTWLTKPLTCSDIAIQTSGRLIVTAVNRSDYALVLGLLNKA